MRITFPFFTFRSPASSPAAATCSEIMAPAVIPGSPGTPIPCTRLVHPADVWHFNAVMHATWRPLDGKGDWLR